MMQFIVISHSESGPLVEEFETKAKAVDFAETVASEGMPSTILMRISEIPAVLPEREDFGVLPGIDFPQHSTTLGKAPSPALAPDSGAGNGIGTPIQTSTQERRI